MTVAAKSKGPVARFTGAVRDSLVNLVSGIGTAADKNFGNQFALSILSEAQLEAAFRGDWVARKIVMLPAGDAVREWRTWSADENQLSLLEAEERRLDIPRKLKLVQVLSRLYGGAGLVIGTGAGDPSTPLNTETMQRGGLKYVHAMSKRQLVAGEIDHDVTSEFFGQPSYYHVGGPGGIQVRIHPSRVIRFVGNPYPDPTTAPDSWGDSVLQSVFDAVQQVGMTSAAIAAMVAEAKVDVFKIPDFMASVGTSEYRDRLLQRFHLANISKSTINALLLDKEEEWDRKETNFGGLPDILKLYLLIASGAADIPVTRMLGQSPAGLNSTGESDIRNYYDHISDEQKNVLGPAIAPLDDLLVRSALGEWPDDVWYIWNPLWQLSDSEKAEIAVKHATAFQADVAAGLIDPVVLAEARINQLVDDETYPGLDALVANMPDMPLPEENPEVEGQFEDSFKYRTSRRFLRTPRGKFFSPRKLKLIPAPHEVKVGDATPKTLYIYRPLLNSKDLIAWAKAQGIATTLKASDMHVTVCYSREEVDWMKVGAAWDEREDGGVIVRAGGPRIVERFKGGAVVLMFASSSLSYRHVSIREVTGASWDYDEYQPHVTITYDPTGQVDVTKLEPYQGELRFGPEYFEEIDDEYKNTLEEEATGDAYNPNQERDPNGQFGSGGGSGGGESSGAPQVGSTGAVKLGQIKSAQAASETDKERVKFYRDKIKNGEELEPVQAVYNSEAGTYHLTDGHHRLLAAKAEKVATIKVKTVAIVKNTRAATEYIRAVRFG